MKNALVLRSWDSEIENLDIEIEGNLIKKVGRVEKDGLDLTGKLVMPAFYNTHTHAAMTLMRGISDDDPFDKWLFEKVLPLESKLDGEMVYWGTMLAMMEMASRGIAAFVDMYFFLEDVVRAVLDFGMRAVITRGLVDEEGDDGGRLEENLNVFKRWNGERGMLRVGFGPHSPYTCTPEYLRRISDIAKTENAMVTMHLREASWERERYDLKEVVEPFKGVDFLAVHVVHINGEEIEILKDNGVKVSHNPSSNLKLGNGVSPVSDLLESGIEVGLGTDGSASNNSLDVWHEMRTATLLQKMRDPTKIDPSQAIRMATEAGAEIMGFNAGRIEPGKLADLVVLNVDSPHYRPLSRLKSHLVHSGNSGDVYATMVNGEWIYMDGKFPKVDRDEITRKFEESVERLLR